MSAAEDLVRKACAAADAVEYSDFDIPDLDGEVREVIRVVLEHLLDYGGEARYNQVELDAMYVERIYEDLVGKPFDSEDRSGEPHAA